ncbi:MAG: hypothetical protein LLG14_16850 [Nocardiaceae bacterium]|nr:hypothetical protein [Nocardiaceae bacterium]
MADFIADADAIRNYGTTAAAMGETIATDGATNVASNMAAVVPVFGLIGQDYLAAFGTAQFNNANSVAELAAFHQATAVAADVAAAGYEGTDATTAAALRTAADES